MHAYILEDENEIARLEKQNGQRLYSVDEELRFVSIKDGHDILDAGCGTGVITRFILNHCKPKTMTALDFSEIRLKETQKILSKDFPHTNVSFKHFDLLRDELPTKKYDHIISRFVMHHLSDPARAVKSLAHGLKPKGELTIIDSDGMLFNLYTEDSWLRDKIQNLHSNMKVDFFVGRKLKSFMNEAGLINIRSRLIPMHFCGEELTHERQQYGERFFAMKAFLESLWGQAEAARFIDSYMEALLKPGTELFYNKFVVQGTRP